MEQFRAGYRSELEGQYSRSTPHQRQAYDEGALCNARAKPGILSIDSLEETRTSRTLSYGIDVCQDIDVILHNIFPSTANSFGTISMGYSPGLVSIGRLRKCPCDFG